MATTETPTYRYSDGRTIPPRNARIVEQGRLAGYPVGRYGAEPETCPWRLRDTRKLWQAGHELGEEQGRAELERIQTSYEAGLEELDQPTK